MEIRHRSPQLDYFSSLPRQWCSACRISWMGAEPTICQRCGGQAVPFGSQPLPPNGRSRTWTPEEYAESAARNATLLLQVEAGHRPPHWALMAKGSASRKPTKDELRQSGQRATAGRSKSKAPTAPPPAASATAQQIRFGEG